MQETKLQTYCAFTAMIAWKCLFFVAVSVSASPISSCHGDLVDELNVCP